MSRVQEQKQPDFEHCCMSYLPAGIGHLQLDAVLPILAHLQSIAVLDLLGDRRKCFSRQPRSWSQREKEQARDQCSSNTCVHPTIWQIKGAPGQCWLGQLLGRLCEQYAGQLVAWQENEKKSHTVVTFWQMLRI